MLIQAPPTPEIWRVSSSCVCVGLVYSSCGISVEGLQMRNILFSSWINRRMESKEQASCTSYFCAFVSCLYKNSHCSLSGKMNKCPDTEGDRKAFYLGQDIEAPFPTLSHIMTTCELAQRHPLLMGSVMIALLCVGFMYHYVLPKRLNPSDLV